jgi:uncharacterized surface protein with fasciclin (FAS1) repeats
MKKSFLIIAASLLVSLTTTSVFAQTKPDTTKQPTPTVDVVGVLASNPDYSSASAAVRAANLESTLKTGGPYTIFAPNNIAFSNLPKAQSDSLMKDPVKLATLLKGHVVTGQYTKAAIIKALTTGKGKATLTTIDGRTLNLSISPKSTLQLTDAAGSTAEVTLYDMVGTNGVVNGINGILK